ncbi:MAG: tRNA (5-methylaminomethyl-2-thiouridine)(34)-methyltransferase MnmD [Bacteroides sp.]|nr:tRNA (5-methylaminomethyl-2-thiouridine)(34)-methyltransferase MnmD [Bacteroides sp.]
MKQLPYSIEIEQTADGSATLFVPAMEEHYHSVKGARSESQHIFVESGLLHSTADPVHVLEIGFGTGLNAMLTLEASRRTHRKVIYTALELYPLEWDTVKTLKYSEDPLFRELHLCPWEENIRITEKFELRKYQTDVTRWSPENEHLFPVPSGFDVVYFDAFAPEKQPEMWKKQLFDKLYVIINKGGVLTTYCAKGSIRRMLQDCGFRVERLPGPPNGKREILRATKPLTTEE